MLSHIAFDHQDLAIAMHHARLRAEYRRAERALVRQAQKGQHLLLQEYGMRLYDAHVACQREAVWEDDRDLPTLPVD